MSQRAQRQPWFLSLALAVCAGAALVGCRATSPLSSAKAELAPVEEVALVYMGGFNSCIDKTPLKLFAISEFNKLKSELEVRGLKVHTVVSCFNGMVSNRILWHSSANPGELKTAIWNQPWAPGQIFDEVRRVSRDFEIPLYVVGHSYGGWLASNLAMNIGASKLPLSEGAVRALFTIDSISPFHCNQLAYAATLAKGLGLGGIFGNTPTEGCESAPRQYLQRDDRKYPDGLLNDKPGRLFELVRRSTQSWMHFYQTKDFLHSSAVPNSADALFPLNVALPYGPFVVGTNAAPHVRIHAERTVWMAIRGRVIPISGDRAAVLQVPLDAGIQAPIAETPSEAEAAEVARSLPSAEQAQALSDFLSAETNGLPLDRELTDEELQRLEALFGTDGTETREN